MIRHKLPAIHLTTTAVSKISTLLFKANNPNLKLRVYITGGGCNGFEYKFTLDDKISLGDLVIEKDNVSLVIDDLSIQYLHGSKIDYIQKLQGSRFLVTNPNAKITCSCGNSFTP
ncbi:MAG: iron-sulfur cluster insertion protein ErpA [Candidatus Dasytiphilus stammeri]